MSCIAELCFISAIYISGGIGYQAGGDQHDWQSSNDYGSNIGELSFVVEFENSAYIELKHVSGLNTDELDGGLNAIMIGARIDLFGGK